MKRFDPCPKEGASFSIPISPFVTTELACLCSNIVKHLEKKRLIIHLSNRKSILGIRYINFKNAVSRIDELIAETELMLLSENVSCCEQLKMLEKLMKEYSDGNAPHHAQSCQEKIDAIKLRSFNTIQGLSKKLLAYSNKKVRLINTVNARISAAKAHRILRIQYYYGCARSHTKPQNNDKQFETKLYTPEVLSAVVGNVILEKDHTGLLNESVKKVKELLKATDERGREDDAAVEQLV